ncbi:MAG TPA: VOC family protein [Streptosporangiaceae bacterium]|jgi:hypothetical protein
MASYIKSVSFDCADALVAARFWAAALNSDVEEDSTPAKAFVEAPGWGGPNIWFNQVPERHPAHVVMIDPDGHEFCVEPGNDQA